MWHLQSLHLSSRSLAPSAFKPLSSSLLSRFVALVFSPHPHPPSRPLSLIASCCHKSNYIGVVSMGNRLPSCLPFRPPFPTSSHTATIILPPSQPPPPPHLYLCAYLHISPVCPFSPSPSLPLFLSPTHTRTQRVSR